MNSLLREDAFLCSLNPYSRFRSVTRVFTLIRITWHQTQKNRETYSKRCDWTPNLRTDWSRALTRILYRYIFHLNKRRKLILFEKISQRFPLFFFIPHKNINFILYNVNPSSRNKDYFVMPVYHKLYTANHHYNNHTTRHPITSIFKNKHTL